MKHGVMYGVVGTLIVLAVINRVSALSFVAGPVRMITG